MSNWNTLATQNTDLLRAAGDITINAQIHRPQLTEAQQSFLSNLQQTTARQANADTNDATMLDTYQKLVDSAEKVFAEAAL